MKELLLLLAASGLLLRGPVDCALCPSIESLDISDGFVHDNGSVFMFGIEFTKQSWYDVVENETTVRFGCPCIERLCMWKCCEVKQAFYNLSCENSSLAEVDPFSPQMYKGQEPSAVLARNTFFYMHGTPCVERYLVDTGVGEQLFLQEVSKQNTLLSLEFVCCSILFK